MHVKNKRTCRESLTHVVSVTDILRKTKFLGHLEKDEERWCVQIIISRQKGERVRVERIKIHKAAIDMRYLYGHKHIDIANHNMNSSILKHED